MAGQDSPHDKTHPCNNINPHNPHSWWERSGPSGTLETVTCEGVRSVGTQISHERIIRQLAFGARKYLGPAMLASANLAMVEDKLTGDLRAELTAFLQAEKVAERRVVRETNETATVVWRVPTSTWAQFKELHRKAWWLRRWYAKHPAKTIEHAQPVHFHAAFQADWETYATYPMSTYIPLDHSVFGVHVGHELLSVDVNARTSLGRQRRS